MNWNSVSDFFAMGGYAFYVWGSFGVTAAALLLETLMVNHRRNAALKRTQLELAARKRRTP